MKMLDNIKYVFQIPLAWFRAVSFFCFGSYGGHLIRITRDKDGAASFDVDEEELAQYIPVISRETGTPENRTDAPDVLDSDGDEWTWIAGGANGLQLDAYYKIGTLGSYHIFQRCRLTISRDGLVVTAEGLPERIRIRA